MIARSHTHVNTSWNFGALGGPERLERPARRERRTSWSMPSRPTATRRWSTWRSPRVRPPDPAWVHSTSVASACACSAAPRMVSASARWAARFRSSKPRTARASGSAVTSARALPTAPSGACSWCRATPTPAPASACPGADVVLGGEPREPLNDRSGSLAARANCKGFAFEYMTGGRVVVLGDPGPWICSGMTGGVIYCRQNPDWNLDSSAIRRRLSKTAKVTMLETRRVGRGAGRRSAGQVPTRRWRSPGSRRPRRALDALIAAPAEHFIALSPVTQQADPNISTE